MLFASILMFASCTNRLSEVSIFSNLQEGDSVSISLYSHAEARYVTVGEATVAQSDVVSGRVDISLPDSFIMKTPVVLFTIYCYSDSVLYVSSIRLKNFRKYNPKDILNNIWWQSGLMFELDADSKMIKSPVNSEVPGIFPVGVYTSNIRPIGIQLFFRFLFVTSLFAITLILLKNASTQRFLLFFIAFFLVTLPLKLHLNNYAAGIMVLAAIVAFFRNRPYRFTWNPIYYVLCAMFLMNVIGLLYAAEIRHGIERLERTLSIVLFPLAFSIMQLSKKNVILLLRFFVWSGIAFCAFSLLSYFSLIHEITWNMVFRDSKIYAGLLLPTPTHPHPSFLSVILLMMIPVSLYLRYDNGKQITLIEMLAGVAFPVVFTVLSGARVGMIIAPALIGLGYMFYCKFKPELKWTIVVAGIITAGVFLYLSTDLRQRFSDPIRVDLRQTAISAIKERPVFGWGTGAARTVIQSEERAQKIGIESPHILISFHNQFLEDTVHFGIFGIAIIITLFGWILWIGLREKQFLLLSFFVIYVLFCWVESPLFTTKGVLSFAFWFCFFISNFQLPKKNTIFAKK